MTAVPHVRTTARFADWVLLKEPLELLHGGQRVRLQDQPLQILESLVSRPGQLVTREELIAKLWPRGVTDFDAGLNTAMRKLRAALDDDADKPVYIETVPRQGYRFIGSLQATLETMVAEPPAAAPPSPAAQPTLKSRLAFSAVLLVVALAIGLWLHRDGTALSPATAANKVRLAVLPLENLSPDPANAFFADGMHEEILSALANNAPNLEVISRTTMMLYRTTPKPVSEIVKDLGVSHVLEGTVRRDGAQVRVTLQLIDARDDRHLWSRSYDRRLVDVMTLQTQVATEVAAQLATQLNANPTQLPASRNLQAYDLWLEGVLAWQNVGGGGATTQEVDRVEGMFGRAIELDPSYAAAYADRARVRVARFVTGTDQSVTNIDGARADVAMARKFAGDTPHVLVREAQVAYLIDGELKKALALIARAEAAGPLDADRLMTKANFLAYSGELDASLAVQEQAARLDPGNPTIFRFWMINLFAAHRPADALHVLRSFDERFPGRIERGELLFSVTGSADRWRAEMNRMRDATNRSASLSNEFELLRYERRSADLKALLAGVNAREYQQHNASRSLIGAGMKPVAELRGWERLLAGDRVGAAREGKAVLDFVGTQTRQKWNGWSLELLAAEGALFVGDKLQASARARQALGLTGSAPNFAVSMYSRVMAARIYAWAGAEDPAMELLEKLATGYPGIGPAAIARDPLFSKPLGKNARWQSLVIGLETEIAENRALL